MAQIQTIQHRDCGECDIQMISDFPLTNNNHSTPLYLAIASPSNCSEDFPRLLFNKTEFIPSLENYNGSAGGLILWQETLDPTYYQRPFEERFELAAFLAVANGSALFRTALDRDSILHSSSVEGFRTFIVIAASIVRNGAILSEYPEAPYKAYYERPRENIKGRCKRNIEDEKPHW